MADTEIVSRNEMAGYTEFVTADVPFLVETRHAGVDILRDLDTRQVIGYRVYDIEEGWARSPSTSTGESDWVLVPREPTQAMLDAFIDEAISQGVAFDEFSPPQYPAPLYRAMLASAPAPDTKQEPVAVKPVKWMHFEAIGPGSPEQWFAHDDLGGTLTVTSDPTYAPLPWVARPFPPGPSNYATADEAKAVLEEQRDARVRSALFPSPVTQKVSEAWQPIETARKVVDETVLLRIEHVNYAIATPDDKHRWQEIVSAYWTDFNGGGWVWHGLAGEPTHWCPIPPLQAQEKSE